MVFRFYGFSEGDNKILQDFVMKQIVEWISNEHCHVVIEHGIEDGQVSLKFNALPPATKT